MPIANTIGSASERYTGTRQACLYHTSNNKYHTDTAERKQFLIHCYPISCFNNTRRSFECCVALHVTRQCVTCDMWCVRIGTNSLRCSPIPIRIARPFHSHRTKPHNKAHGSVLPFQWITVDKALRAGRGISIGTGYKLSQATDERQTKGERRRDVHSALHWPARCAAG